MTTTAKATPTPSGGHIFQVAVSGHRDLTSAAPAVIRKAIGQLVDLYPSALWLAGGATGTDQIATGELLDRGQKVRLVLPFNLVIQARLWSESRRRILLDQIARAAGVEVVADQYHPKAYLDRNRRLVERADLLVAFYSGRSTGGTAHTIRLAARRRLPVLVWWV